jgi:hypothetical protein
MRLILSGKRPTNIVNVGRAGIPIAVSSNLCLCHTLQLVYKDFFLPNRSYINFSGNRVVSQFVAERQEPVLHRLI